MLNSIRNLFRLEKAKGLNAKALKDIGSLYIYWIGNAFSRNYIEYESNGDKYKTIILILLDNFYAI